MPVLEGRAAAVSFAVLLAAAAPSAADEPRWRVDRGELRIVVPMKPGGAFDATTSALSGTLGAGNAKPMPLSGELRLDLRTIETGIALRNQHLRENYLEVDKGANFDTAVLSNIELADADGPSFRGKTAWKGVLLLHGTKSQVQGTGEIRQVGDDVRVQATFPLALTDFGITPPEYMGVGVGNRLIVNVTFTATPEKDR